MMKMSNLYFSSCSVKRECKVENGECKADLQRNITKVDAHEYDVELQLSVKKSDLSVSIVSKAHFIYDAETFELEENIVTCFDNICMFIYVI